MVIPRAVIDSIRAQRLRCLPTETGGFLLGMRRGHHLEVTGVTEQQAQDLATTYTFERRDPAHARAIEAEWRRSNSLITVLGDWHTHPYGSGDPSGMDKKAWRTLARAVAQPVIGLIDAGTTLPTVFYLREKSLFASTLKLQVVSEEDGDLAYSS